MFRPQTSAGAVSFAAVLLVAATSASAQIAVSANDGKVKLVNGAAQVVKEPVPDTISIIDLAQTPPKILSELAVPTSVVGPPMSVAISPDE